MSDDDASYWADLKQYELDSEGNTMEVAQDRFPYYDNENDGYDYDTEYGTYDSQNENENNIHQHHSYFQNLSMIESTKYNSKQECMDRQGMQGWFVDFVFVLFAFIFCSVFSLCVATTTPVNEATTMKHQDEIKHETKQEMPNQKKINGVESKDNKIVHECKGMQSWFVDILFVSFAFMFCVVFCIVTTEQKIEIQNENQLSNEFQHEEKKDISFEEIVASIREFINNKNEMEPIIEMKGANDEYVPDDWIRQQQGDIEYPKIVGVSPYYRSNINKKIYNLKKDYELMKRDMEWLEDEWLEDEWDTQGEMYNDRLFEFYGIR